MRTIRAMSPWLSEGLAVAWAKATQFQLDQSLGMLRVTVARLPTEAGTLTLVATVAPLRSNAAMAFPAILPVVTAPSARLPVATWPAPILEEETAPGAILEKVTASLAILFWVTDSCTIFWVETAPS